MRHSCGPKTTTRNATRAKITVRKNHVLRRIWAPGRCLALSSIQIEKRTIMDFCRVGTYGANRKTLVAWSAITVPKSAASTARTIVHARSRPGRSRATSIATPPRVAHQQPALWQKMFAFSGTSAIVARPATFYASPHPEAWRRQPENRRISPAAAETTAPMDRNIPAMKK